MEKHKDATTSRTDPGGTSVGSTDSGKEELNWYKKEVQQLRGKIQGFQVLGSLLQESKSEIRRLKTSNTELLQRMDTILANPSAPSSVLISLASSQSINSLTEEKRILSGEGSGQQQRKTGHASVASENSELSDMEIVNQDDVAGHMEDDTRFTSQTAQSLEIDPYDLHARMEGSIDPTALNPQDPFSLQNLTNPRHSASASQTPSQADLSESIVLISPEEGTRLQNPLVNQVRQISEALTRNVGLNSPSELSDALARLAIDVLKIEKELRMKQVMINSLCPENEQLKHKLEATIQAREESILQLRKEKRELQEKVVAAELRVSSPKTPAASPQEWVHVQDPQISEEIATVNERWEKHTRELESLQSTEVSQLQRHLEDARRRLRQAEGALSKCQEDNEKHLHMAKARVEEEQKSKDVAIQHFHREQERRHQCETELITARRQSTALTDRVATLETQLAILQDTQFTSNNLSPEETLSSLAALSPEELRTQVQILRHQGQIYKEDFDRERQDRERMQADKDVIKSALDRYKTDLLTAQRKVRELETERDILKSENVCLRQEFQQIRQSEQDVVRLHSENAQLREQLQQKIEEIRRLTTSLGTSSNQLNVYPQERPTASAETWRCTACTFDNPAVRSSCEVCGRSRNRTTRSPTPTRQAPRLIPHSGPPYGWTECDTTTGGRVTAGDDLIIDQGEDIPDMSRN